MPKIRTHFELSDPVPTISDNIALYIDKIINELNFTFFIEYGVGNSTRYFLKTIFKAKKKVTFIAMEYNQNWFLHTVEAIKSDFSIAIDEPNQLKIAPWSYGKCKKYFEGKNVSNLQIPENLKRSPKARRNFSGMLNYKMILYRFLKKSRPSDGVFYAKIDQLITLFLYLKRDFIKDQYGESPIKNEYIYVPFKYFSEKIEKREKVIALFIIDGGPRFDILKGILDMEEKNDNFFPIIFLCDANRIFYNEQIKRRPIGNYIKGTNRTLNNSILYGNKKKNSAEKNTFSYGKEDVPFQELIEKEVWYYNSVG